MYRSRHQRCAESRSVLFAHDGVVILKAVVTTDHERTPSEAVAVIATVLYGRTVMWEAVRLCNPN